MDERYEDKASRLEAVQLEGARPRARDEVRTVARLAEGMLLQTFRSFLQATIRCASPILLRAREMERLSLENAADRLRPPRGWSPNSDDPHVFFRHTVAKHYGPHPVTETSYSAIPDREYDLAKRGGPTPGAILRPATHPHGRLAIHAVGRSLEVSVALGSCRLTSSGAIGRLHVAGRLGSTNRRPSARSRCRCLVSSRDCTCQSSSCATTAWAMPRSWRIPRSGRDAPMSTKRRIECDALLEVDGWQDLPAAEGLGLPGRMMFIEDPVTLPPEAPLTLAHLVAKHYVYGLRIIFKRADGIFFSRAVARQPDSWVHGEDGRAIVNRITGVQHLWIGAVHSKLCASLQALGWGKPSSCRPASGEGSD